MFQTIVDFIKTWALLVGFVLGFVGIVIGFFILHSQL